MGMIGLLMLISGGILPVVAREPVPYSVSEVQSALNAAGFPSGTPDGIWGSKSQKALRDYQSAKGLPLTGVLDSATIAILFPLREVEKLASVPLASQATKNPSGSERQQTAPAYRSTGQEEASTFGVWSVIFVLGAIIFAIVRLGNRSGKGR
jgi:hypothetical protein